MLLQSCLVVSSSENILMPCIFGAASLNQIDLFWHKLVNWHQFHAQLHLLG